MAAASIAAVSMAAAPLRQPPVWTAPLVPIGLALTVGIVLDRFINIPLTASLCLALASTLIWLMHGGARNRLVLLYLLGGVAGLGAAYHHWYRDYRPATDISHRADRADRAGQPARLRGNLTSAPTVTRGQPVGPLRSFPTQDVTHFVLQVVQWQDLSIRHWTEVSGLVQVTIIGPAGEITVGDEVELLGRLVLPGEASNPGGFDYASFLHDQGITAILTVIDSDEVFLVRRGWPTSFFGWLAVVRGWAQRTLEDGLATQHAVAAALLLGEGSAMSGDDWEKYQDTGVIHVLAISGQHLVVLAGFLWYAAWLVGLRRRRAAILIALALLGYALLTGGRPPVMRAAWAITAYCMGIVFQRPTQRANTFALAWIVVALANPTDLFSAGCQLSFLAVAVLVWGAGRWVESPLHLSPIQDASDTFASRARQMLRYLVGSSDPLQMRIDEARPWYSALAVRLLRLVAVSYLINGMVWLAVSPLVAAYFHVVSPIALVIGPPMVLLTSIALMTGFFFLALAGWCAPLAWPFAMITRASLSGCELLVTCSQNLPLAYGFVPDVPGWWLWIFYIGLLLGLTLSIDWPHGRWAVLAGLTWLVLGIILILWPHRPGEFRCTFVAVGHGGCTVIESPRGHVLLYDSGATTGPEVTRKHIAPYLWSRGIRRIDEVVVSHADLDHFNGLEELNRRFTIVRAITTPSFATRDLPAVRRTLSVLERSNIPRRIVYAERRWEADGISFSVLHPPTVGPAGKENERSMVLLVRYEDCSILLTGDLEEAGLKQVLSLPPPRIDILMAPHHGSDRSNIPALAAWAKPKWVVSCQTRPLNERAAVAMYNKIGIPFLGTWPHGAVTIRHASALTTVKTYRTGLNYP